MNGSGIQASDRRPIKAATRPATPMPVDIWSVKEYGLERWLADMAWPVTDPELRALYRDVDEMLTRTIGECGPELGDAFSVIFNAAGEHYVSALHALIVRKRMEKAGFTPASRPGNRHFDAPAGAVEPLPVLTAEGALPAPPSFRDRARGTLRLLSDRARYRLSRRSARAEDCLCFYTPAPENEWYAESVGKGIGIVHPRQFMPDRPVAAVRIPGDTRAIDRLLEGLAEIAERRGATLDEVSRSRLRDATQGTLRHMGAYVTAIEGRLRNRKPAEFMVSDLGQGFVRSLCVAGRRQGYRMIGFGHGSSAGKSKVPTHAYVDMAMVDTYVVPTAAAARLFGELQSRYRIRADHEVRVLSCDDGASRKAWEADREKPLPAAIRTVLVVETPIAHRMNRDICMYWPHHLEMTLRIGKSLRNAGVRTILKRHPDRLRESEGLYGPHFDEVVAGRFETVYEAADAVFFPYICSSTFGFALLSNKTILFLENMLDTVHEEAHKPLRKRCRVIPSAFNAAGRLEYDEGSLLDALRTPPARPDPEFVQRYMLP